MCILANLIKSKRYNVFLIAYWNLSNMHVSDNTCKFVIYILKVMSISKLHYLSDNYVSIQIFHFYEISEKCAFDCLKNIIKKLLVKNTVTFVKNFNNEIDLKQFVRFA